MADAQLMNACSKNGRWSSRAYQGKLLRIKSDSDWKDEFSFTFTSTANRNVRICSMVR